MDGFPARVNQVLESGEYFDARLEHASSLGYLLVIELTYLSRYRPFDWYQLAQGESWRSGSGFAYTVLSLHVDTRAPWVPWRPREHL